MVDSLSLLDERRDDTPVVDPENLLVGPIADTEEEGDSTGEYRIESSMEPVV